MKLTWIVTVIEFCLIMALNSENHKYKSKALNSKNH